MPTNYKDLDILNDFYYRNDTKLMRRISMWNNFGTNEMTYSEFLHSLLNKDYDVYADIGCGNAFYSSELLKYINKEAYFLDSSKAILEDAKKRITYTMKKPNLKTFFVSSDLTKTSFSDHQFNLITLMHVLQHVNNLELAMRELRRIIDKDGEIIITTYNNSLNDWLNRTHYETIRELEFPCYMSEVKDYLRFSGDNAFVFLKDYFSRVDRIDYNNDAIISDPVTIMEYYQSGMMYRMSEGENDKMISSEKWEKLRQSIECKLEKELKNKGNIRIEGNVTAFRVKA